MARFRRTWRWSFVLLAAAFLALVRPAAAFNIIITEPQVPLVPNSVLELAKSLGYFQREGVDVNFIRVLGTPAAVSALISGHGDMANISLQSLLTLSAHGEQRLRAVGSPNKSLSFMIVGHESIKSVGDLRGKVFGIGAVGSLDDTLTWQVLRQRGLDPKDVHAVSVGDPHARLLALLAGKVDATTASFGSWLTLPKKTGLHVIVSKADYFKAAPIVAKVDVVSQATLDTKRSEITKVTTALIKLSRAFARDPQLWVKSMHAARPDVPVKELEMMAAAYAGDWCVDGGLDRGELEASAKLLFSSPKLAHLKLAPIDKWADFTVVNDVLGKLGPSRARAEGR
ncbi:MAG TPA: ABC transporter substrate-binding protein [Pseudolabrys sp.]|nr:ABC transporter substrate-binding protein [Pseudolabrys sp.]